jgi:hypothetical protein
MMTDIVTELRQHAEDYQSNFGLMIEAASMIEDLRFAALAVDDVNERLLEELADVRADAALLRAELREAGILR